MLDGYGQNGRSSNNQAGMYVSSYWRVAYLCYAAPLGWKSPSALK
jgi:hypothetical protein